MGTTNWWALRASVRIEMSDGTAYEMDLVKAPGQELLAKLSIDTEPVETLASRMGLLTWREYEPGHKTGAVTLRGRLAEARRIAPTEENR